MVYKDKSDLIKRTVSDKDIVLDVGFWGQGINVQSSSWPHRILFEQAQCADGVDLVFDEKIVQNLNPRGTYFKASAEDFEAPRKYTKVFAADIIEHLPNPGLFLHSCKKVLTDGGELILTTPNAFNLFNIAGKWSREEPTVNKDHVCYFNKRTLETLLNKCGWSVRKISYVYTLGELHDESVKKHFLNFVYYLLHLRTQKFLETLVIHAYPNQQVTKV